jgi:HEAT repeat protein
VALLLVLIWVLLMVFRWQLRAEWWAYQVTQAESAEGRDFYVTRLASIRDKSLTAVPMLTEHPDAGIRLAGITILRYCESPRAAELLLGMLGDTNPDVSGAAATNLAWRSRPASFIPQLRELATSTSPAAWGATVALGRIGGDEAEQTLEQILSTADNPNVKAQAIDSLGLLGREEALPLMQKALADERHVDHLPHSQLSAMRAIGALSADLSAKGIDPASAADSASTAPTVGAIAAHWIRLLSATTTSSAPRH